MSISASSVVSVNPGVIGSGGNPLSLNGVILSKNTLIPFGNVMSFSTALAVSDYFGSTSQEYLAARVYFLGFNNSTKKPGTLYFAPFTEISRSAWLRGGSLNGLTLEKLQEFQGDLHIILDGFPVTGANINLAAATSFSNAATLIQDSLVGAGASPVVTWDSVQSVFVFTNSSSGATSTITYAEGTIAPMLKLTSTTGAILSQGSDATTEIQAMDSVVKYTQNFVSFTTMWEPTLERKLKFADWTSSQNQRYVYVAWDTDQQAIVNGSTTCFGKVANSLEYDAVLPVYNTLELAVFFMGFIGSIDFQATNGRATGAFKSQSGLAVTCSDNQIAANLLDNGYSFYGNYSTANDSFNFSYSTKITGKWKFLDTFVNQVYLNNQIQLAQISFLANINSVPYNTAGYALISASMLDPINQSINFGGIRKGVTLSEAQKALVNNMAGKDVSGIIYSNGYYLEVLDPGAQARGNRESPIINLIYTDGGAIHKLSTASVDVL